MANRDPLEIAGETIADKYVVEQAVGEGGFAVVYRAQHAIWKKPVAIKFFSELSSAPVDQREELQEAFIQEGALLTELSSQTAGIVQARDVGTYTTPKGRWMPFMVLEWLDGQSLEEVIEQDAKAGRPPWSLQEVCWLMRPVCEALDVAHGKGIAHRDIKPANIFVLSESRIPGATIKILDFGVAKMITDNTQMKAALAKTGTNVTSFTPQYGAPEQFSRSYGATGPWTDVFALALLAMELLLGRTALDGEDLIQLAYSASNPAKRPTPLSQGLTVPAPVEAVFAKAFAVAPQERYARASEFLVALEQAVGTAGADIRNTALSRTAADTDVLARTIAATDPSLATLGQIGATAPGYNLASQHATTSSPAMIPAPAAGTGKGKAGLMIAGGVALAGMAAAVFFALRDGGEEEPAGPVASATASATAPASSASAAAIASCPDEMVLIPAGEFYMGSDQPNALDNEKPAHNVKLNAFCMDKYEVTREKYVACSDRGACPRAGREAHWPDISAQDKTAYTPLCNGEATDRNQHPINCVTWRHAETYCRKKGKRLPTEAEWEYATRGPDGRVYPWGDEEPTAKHLNACDSKCAEWAEKAGVKVDVLFENEDDGFAATAPVGQYEGGKSRFGPYDVVGNVWEWVADYYGPYGSEELDNPSGPKSGDKRVIRGGAWNGGYSTWLRPSFRYANDPDVRSPGIGFRCAQSVEKAP